MKTQDKIEQEICQALEVEGREVREFHWSEPIGNGCGWWVDLAVGDLVGISLKNISRMPNVSLRHIDRDGFENDPDPREEGRVIAIYCIHGWVSGKGVTEFVQRTHKRQAVTA